jgi:hypothetical protein
MSLLIDLLERPASINNIHKEGWISHPFEWMNKATDEEIELLRKNDNPGEFWKDMDRQIVYDCFILELDSVKMVCIKQEGHDYDIGFELNKIYDVNMTRNKNSFYLMDNAHHFHQIENNSKYLITLSEFREKRINKILE